MTIRKSDCFSVCRIKYNKIPGAVVRAVKFSLEILYFVKTERCYMHNLCLNLNFTFALHTVSIKSHFCIIHLDIITRRRLLVQNMMTIPKPEAGVSWI